MNFQQLRSVREAVRQGFNLTAVAQTLHTSQPGPEEVAEQREHLAQTLERIAALPAGLRDAMQLRVLLDEPTDAVCRTLAISEANLFVRLHRARRQLLHAA